MAVGLLVIAALCAWSLPGAEAQSPIASPNREAEARAHYERASRYYVESRFEAAISELTKSIELSPRQPRVLKLLGLCYQLVSRNRQAEAAFRRALDLDERDAEGWYYLGRLFYAENFFDKALPPLEKAVRLDPREWRAHECLALTLEAVGEDERALEAIGRAVFWNGQRKAPWYSPDLNYGMLLYKAGRFPEAEKHFLRAREINPRDWQTRFELGKLYFRTERLEAAVAELRASLSGAGAEPGDNARAYRLLGQVLARLGRAEEARQAVAMAEKVAP